VADVPTENFNGMFADFSVRVVGVEAGFFLLGQLPAPFSNHILTLLRSRRPLVPPPAKSSSPNAAYIIFSGCVIEHEGGGVEVRAHWWPSHGWIINQRVTLTASDPFKRNEQLEHAYTALDFFLLETRGAPKIDEADVRRLFERGTPTQEQAAETLGVTVRGLDKWRKKRGFETWRAMVEHYALADVEQKG
jgi:hypothetical protein